MSETTYWVEIQDRSPRRYYVYYHTSGPIKTLFDVCETREKAEKAIEDHKAGKHPTQWKPEGEA